MMNGGMVYSDAEKHYVNEERIGRNACVHGDVSGRTDKDKLGEAVCAFANDMSDCGKPGYLF